MDNYNLRGEKLYKRSKHYIEISKFWFPEFFEFEVEWNISNWIIYISRIIEIKKIILKPCSEKNKSGFPKFHDVSTNLKFRIFKDYRCLISFNILNSNLYIFFNSISLENPTHESYKKTHQFARIYYLPKK